MRCTRRGSPPSGQNPRTSCRSIPRGRPPGTVHDPPPSRVPISRPQWRHPAADRWVGEPPSSIDPSLRHRFLPNRRSGSRAGRNPAGGPRPTPRAGAPLGVPPGSGTPPSGRSLHGRDLAERIRKGMARGARLNRRARAPPTRARRSSWTPTDVIAARRAENAMCASPPGLEEPTKRGTVTQAVVADLPRVKRRRGQPERTV
jgi:hypothetical protein